MGDKNEFGLHSKKIFFCLATIWAVGLGGAGLGPGKKTRLIIRPGLGRGSKPAGRVRVCKNPARTQSVAIPNPHRVSTGLAWGPLTYPYVEITCISQPKALPRNQISYIWKGDPKYLGTLLSTRKYPRIKDSGRLPTTI